MKPTQCIEINDWVSCSGGLPLGSSEQSCVTDLDVDVLFECEMDPHENSGQDIISVSILASKNYQLKVIQKSMLTDNDVN